MYLELFELSLKKPPVARGGIQVLVDVLGVRKLEQTSSKANAKADGVWALDFQRTYSLAKQTPLREAFSLALGSEAREDSEVMLVVQCLDRAGDASDIGVCHVSLEALLTDGKDLRRQALPVVSDDKRPLGMLTLSLSALPALRAIDAERGRSDGGGGGSSGRLSLVVEELRGVNSSVMALSAAVLAYYVARMVARLFWGLVRPSKTVSKDG